MQNLGAKECDPRLARVLQAQYRVALSKPHPHLLALMSEQDVRVWHFLAVGLAEPLLGGEYVFKLTAPDEFPHKPPRFEFVTPNGIFTPGGPICISVGEFHADDKPGKEGSYGWRPSLGMPGFAAEVVNGLINCSCLESGIRITPGTPDSLKAMYARVSRAHNAKSYPALAAEFERVARLAPDSEPALALARGRQPAAAPASAPPATAPPGAAAPPGVAPPAAVPENARAAPPAAARGTPAGPRAVPPAAARGAPAGPRAVPPAAARGAPVGPRADNLAMVGAGGMALELGDSVALGPRPMPGAGSGAGPGHPADPEMDALIDSLLAV